MRALIALVALSTACGGASRPAGKGADSLAGREVRHVTIVGNEAFSDGDIIATLAHRPRSGWPLFRKYTHYDPFALRVDAKRVAAYYHERGYFSAKATSSVKPGGDKVDVSFEVIEGPPAKLQSVEVEGAPPEMRKAIGSLVEDSDLATGERLVHPRYTELKTKIVQVLVKEGYAHAQVTGEVQVDVARAQAAIRIDVDAGPIVRFGETFVTGNRRFPTDAIRARVAWSKGDRFDPKRIELTQKRLVELGVFGSVRIDIQESDRAPIVDTDVIVSEGKRNEVKLGGGFGVDAARAEVRVRAGYRRKGVFHPLVELRLDGKLGYAVIPAKDEPRAIIAEGVAALSKNDLIWPRLKLTGEISFEKDVFEAYQTLGPSARVALSQPFGAEDRLSANVGWQIRRLTIDSDDPRLDAALGDVGAYRLTFFDQSISYDGRDNRFVPRLGWYADLRIEQGGSYSGGTFEYLRATPDLRGFVPLSRKWVLAARLRGGLMRAFGDGPTPLTQRYFGGGSSSHRGFGFRRLSPFELDSNGTRLPVGGNALIESSAELRYTLPWDPFRAVLFADGADVTAELDDIDLAQLHWAVGFGLRIDTIVGPGRLDFAWRLNRTGIAESDGRLNPSPGGSYAIHFSLGEAF